MRVLIFCVCIGSIEKFSNEMDRLLLLTLTSGLVEKLSIALYDCLFYRDEVAEAEDEEVRTSVIPADFHDHEP